MTDSLGFPLQFLPVHFSAGNVDHQYSHQKKAFHQKLNKVHAGGRRSGDWQGLFGGGVSLYAGCPKSIAGR